jgi:hypothetical protein
VVFLSIFEDFRGVTGGLITDWYREGNVWVQVARGKLVMFSTASMPIPVRTLKIGQMKFFLTFTAGGINWRLHR